MTKIAINGLGRLGRELIYQILTDTSGKLELVLVNDENIFSVEKALYFLTYNSTNLGRRTECSFQISTGTDNSECFNVYNSSLALTASDIRYCSNSVANAPWGELGVDIIIDCTGNTASDYLATYKNINGVKKVFYCGINTDDTEYGQVYTPGVIDSVVLNNKNNYFISLCDAASQAIASILYILSDKYTLTEISGTIVQAYTNDQTLLDGPKIANSLERCRAAAENIVPSTTSLACLNRLCSALNGNMTFKTFRVPVSIGAAISLSIYTETSNITQETINNLLKSGPNIKYYTSPFTSDGKFAVSSDIIGETSAVAVLPSYTTCKATNMGTRINIVGLYDNESGFASQIVKTLLSLQS